MGRGKKMGREGVRKEGREVGKVEEIGRDGKRVERGKRVEVGDSSIKNKNR